ncbi:helix-turn-helix domain-containing protein [Fluviicola sp.]|uniref:winged helix-turn-helix transcriptional regulator n=1 Tax=Fluviicola sp. TaxID=1917219 RepID=UPI0031E2F9A9
MNDKIENCNPGEEYYQAILRSVGDSLYAIGGKWKLKIIISLFNGTKRFNDLQRSVTGISARVLSNELKELELNGFVKRKVNTEHFTEVIEYELTDYSFTLNDVIMSLSHWGVKHREHVKTLP